MKVYFTAATSFNGELHETYEKIGLLIKQHRLEIISGNQIIDKSILAKDKSLSSQQIFAREHNLIDEADLLIVEGSRPSLGVGAEITYALGIGKPVLVLVSTMYEDKISPLIKGDPSESLFLRYYNDDNLKYKISDFVSYVQAGKKRQGKLIVIDGGDGSGKTTQANMLVEYLKKKQMPVKYVDFPQYYHSFHGKTVAKFLRGEFGKIDEVSPYLASLAYALDRATMRREMEDFLNKGGHIIANRYATSSMAHQGAKFEDEKERKEFLKWLYELEYKIHRIPKENLVIYLHVPWQIGLELSGKKTEIQTYLKGKEDIHEKDIKHRIEAEKMYLELAKKYKHWTKIECVEQGKLLSKEEIFKEILKVL
ncbi:nucleoside 2-deoxyribosyltransferase [Candidatus Roizmanbacteria bacterium]|nr:nucleoside 2-deoxyribosyltransferase [Candidatus Roizmanbacteria bacterium]